MDKQLGFDHESMDLFYSYCTIVQLIRDSIAGRKITEISALDQRRGNLHKRLLAKMGCAHPENHDELPKQNCIHPQCLKYRFALAVEEVLEKAET